MDPTDARTLIARIAEEIWNRGDLSVVDEVMAPEGAYHGPHMPGGTGDRETWRRAVGAYLAAFPDSHVTFNELLVCGDAVVGRWSATGTHTGPLPGVEPTGRRIEIGGITIYRLAEGRVVEAWEQLDMLGMWRQIGVVEVPGHG